MTYDKLYEHVLSYVAMPHTTITEHDRRRACLILCAFMEFILDCNEAGVDVRTLEIDGFITEKINQIESK